MNFHDNYDVIDPFVLYDNIPQPEYLEINDDDDDSIRDYEGYSVYGGGAKSEGA